MTRTLCLVGAPSSAGAYAPGQEKAPAAFRRHGLVPALAGSGRRVNDHGDVPSFRWRPDPQRPKAMNLDAVRRTAAAVADKVGEAMAGGGAALVLGGDCTVELGTVAGALRDEHSVGLIYIDLDVDLNTPETSDGALDWTGVAHLLDRPGTEAALSGLGPRRPMLAPADILYFAADNITPPEAEAMHALDLGLIALAEVKADPIAAARRAAAWGARYDRLLIHLDVDVLSFTDFPIAENIRRCDGLSFDALAAALALLVAAPNWRALTVTEVNPDHAPDERAAFDRLIAMLTEALPA
ncbi:arginase family protein [Roseomonas hellenica]|uniref:Arginase family protein n=1 Tax=Plastoroseomonas hellenica TaxID=2687306 RepID=A0ABS5EUY7_9PROT|nr:arginase family protein [Plastoroseomonas hellenica]MBR0664102.1 arginase family protein [Plastoroseomonas hellenica]